MVAANRIASGEGQNGLSAVLAVVAAAAHSQDEDGDVDSGSEPESESGGHVEGA